MTTIIIPISRPDYLNKLFSRLEILDCDRDNTSLITYVDGDYQLFQEARNLTQNSKFDQRLCVYRSKGLPNVGSVRRRRERIATIHNEIKSKLTKIRRNTDYVFLLEDDTIFPTDSLKKLMSTLDSSINVSMVSGIQIGRWGFNHIGAWRADDIYDVKRIVSTKLEEGVQEVDGTGLYCCLMRKKTYMDHEFKPFGNILGPDFELGVSLRREGYKVLVDFSVRCQHLKKKEVIHFSNTEIEQVELKLQENGDWSQKRL